MGVQYSRAAKSELETASLAEALAGELMSGDVIALSGDLGAGKTAFSRAIIRAATKNAEMDVPSPTFTLVQTYDWLEGTAIVHADLYRLNGPEDMEDLGLDDEREAGVFLFEWPDRLPDWWRGDALEIVITVPEEAGEETRQFLLSSNSYHWAERLRFLAENGAIKIIDGDEGI